MSQASESASPERELIFLATIAHELTTYARYTYEAGTDNILRPQVLRAYNEILHRVTAAVLQHLQGTPTFSSETISEMVQAFGERHNCADQMRRLLARAQGNRDK